VAGPGRVELKLEEDVESEEPLSEAPEQGVEELGLEEEESEENEVKLEATIEAPEEGGRKTFPLGEHEVVEEVTDEPVSALRCIKCGASVKLTEALRLKQMECKGKPIEKVEETKSEVEGFCSRCGTRTQVLPSYVGPLCRNCADLLERYSLTSRPVVVRRGWLGGRHPADVDKSTPTQVKVAWVGELKTFFVNKDGSWLCPYCGAGFGTLAEATAHTAERHPMMLKWEWTLVRGVGEVVATGQGYFCPVCGLLCPSEEELRRHYQSHEAR